MWEWALVGAALVAAMVAGHWMGSRSSHWSLAAADSVLAAASRALDQSIEQARLAERISSLETLVQMQTVSAEKAALSLDRLDANFHVLLETFASRGMVRKSHPLQAGEVDPNRQPAPMPMSSIPVAKPASTVSTAPPIATG